MPFRLAREDTGRVKGTSNGGRLPTRRYRRCEWDEHVPEDAERAGAGRPTLCDFCGKKVKLCPSCGGFHLASRAKYAVFVERCHGRRRAREFSDAAAAGDAAKVSELIDDGVDVNAVDVENGCATACYRAAEKGHAAVVKLLLDFRADVRAAELAERLANTPEAIAEKKRLEEEAAAVKAAVLASAASKDISASSKVREFAVENGVTIDYAAIVDKQFRKPITDLLAPVPGLGDIATLFDDCVAKLRVQQRPAERRVEQEAKRMRPITDYFPSAA